MARQRSDDQAVDAFSAPRELLRSAQLRARQMRMSKSGFYRYCLAKEIGYTEAAARAVAEHGAVGHFNIVQIHNGTGSNVVQREERRVAEESSRPAAPEPPGKPVKYAAKPRAKRKTK